MPDGGARITLQQRSCAERIFAMSTTTRSPLRHLYNAPTDTDLLRLMLGIFTVAEDDDGIEHLAYQGGGDIRVQDIYSPEQEQALIARKHQIADPEIVEIPKGFEAVRRAG